MDRRRVVVTGVGVVSPVGNDAATTRKAIFEGESGIAPITAFDTTGFEVTIAGEVKGFDPLAYTDKRTSRRMDRFTLFAMAAGDEAIKTSGLLEDKVDAHRVGSFIGTGIGGIAEMESQHANLTSSGPRRVSVFTIPKLMSNAAAGHICIRHGFKGPSFSVSSACASAANAIGEAFRSICHGTVDVQVCGGTEAACTPLGVSGFSQLKALSKRNDEPEKASRPFEKNRDGFVLAEGCGVLVLEALEHAKARSAPVLAEIVGYGGSSDASHVTLPDPEGKGAAAAMVSALADAGMEPGAVSYVNAHGTATTAGDEIEAKAICKVFGDHAFELAVSSSKSTVGHLLGASGALESAICIWAIQDDLCPPTINLDEPDPECCGLNFVPHTAQSRPVEVAMNNSFGFGGHNVTLIFKKFEE